MDPVDILTMAVDAARVIRSSAAPQALMEEACRLVGVPLAEPGESLAVQVARLVEGAGEQRGVLRDFLTEHRGVLYLNRQNEGWAQITEPPASDYEPDPEIPELLEYVCSEKAQGKRVNLLERGPWPFAVGSRQIVHYIGCELEGGATVEMPDTARGLIDYPLENPVLFHYKTGPEGWYLWDILIAFADQYERIYQQPTRYGVWGHDLSDLWIEHLYYYPERNLIYPEIGS